MECVLKIKYVLEIDVCLKSQIYGNAVKVSSLKVYKRHIEMFMQIPELNQNAASKGTD